MRSGARCAGAVHAWPPDGLAVGFVAGVVDGLADVDGFADVDGLADVDGFADVDGLADVDTCADGELFADGFGDAAREPEADGEPDADGDAVGDAVGDVVAEGEPDGLSVGDGVALGDAETLAGGGGGRHAFVAAPSTAPSALRLKTGFGAATMPSAMARAASACGACWSATDCASACAWSAYFAWSS